MKKLLIAKIFAVILMLGNIASAEVFEKSYRDWDVSSLVQDGQKVCYITTTPKKEKGNYKRRGTSYMLVTYRQNGPVEVSVSSGYKYKRGSKISVSFAKGASYNMYTADETPEVGWAIDSNTDNKMVASMKKGSSVTVKGTSILGTYSEDTYSLMGFTKAFSRMKQICK